MIVAAPGDVLRVPLQVLNTSNVPTDADATPAFALWRGDAVDGAVSATVAKPASTTGLYIALLTIPTSYAEGDYLFVRATYALSAANRAEILLRIRITSRINALESLAENQGTLLAQMQASMINVQAEVNTVRQIMAAGVSLNSPERDAVANAVWAHVDGRDLSVAVCGTGGEAGADTNNLITRAFTRNGTTLNVRTNSARNYRSVSR